MHPFAKKSSALFIISIESWGQIPKVLLSREEKVKNFGVLGLSSRTPILGAVVMASTPSVHHTSFGFDYRPFFKDYEAKGQDYHGRQLTSTSLG